MAVYSGNSLGEKGEVRGIQLKKHLGICLETQCLPDAVHHSDFPSVILNEGEEYSTVTKYRFGVSLKKFFHINMIGGCPKVLGTLLYKLSAK